ncbi:site-specific DNA-methyltransferase [Marinobacter alexandrii]|jgi:adenine-specific DNA-methyltransferase|uniref:site-specific DNA-methyltransferase n=1 Tax=Marinobacter alexandrii TaxID=2570351 RepID=UPI002ABDF753|nr:site-specific DNA-methyltransferase [Marinobacter alexandrii]
MSNATQQLKAQQRRQKFADLLREMFQLNQPELDFGLYRIMHARKDDINRFIEQDLPRLTQEAFSQYASQDQAQLKSELEEHIKSAKGLGMDPDSIPKVKELKQQLQSGFDLAREEGEVYDALVTFFNRYYNEGDFLSRRVYKDGTYAIPYQGEEVVLHWANKDQYYIKSSETLRDYSFRLNPDAGPGEDPMRVHFKLVDAEAGAKDNNKESHNSRRVFLLDVENPFELLEGEANEYGERHTELQCRFIFRPAIDSDWTEKERAKATAAAQKKPPTQDALRAIAEERLLGSASSLLEPWRTALAKPYLKADGNRADYSIFSGQLNNYTKKNTFDYFIHKDLGGFLTRELDFFIKNELLDWSDIAALKNDPTRLAPLLSKIEVIRSLAGYIIEFLSQLENFQKKLWLKKKFVTQSHYCMTLDKLEEHPDLLEEALTNNKQLTEWRKLYKVDIEKLQSDRELLNIKDLIEKPEYRYMMIDTALFKVDFKQRLISRFVNIDADIDGFLINSDNFQALNLASSKLMGEFKCIYIDPPYNTGKGDFLYKDKYFHSSWLSMIRDRYVLGSKLLSEGGVQFTSIDDAEVDNYRKLLEAINPNSELAVLAWDRNRKNDARFFSVGHEYMVVHAKNKKFLEEAKIRFREPKEGLAEAKALILKLRKKYGDNYDKIKSEWLSWLDNMPLSDPRRRMRRYTKVNIRGPYRDDKDPSWPGGGGPRYEIRHPITKKVVRVPSRGWVWPTPERFWEVYEEGKIIFGPDHTTTPGVASYLFEGDDQVMPSIFYSYAQTASQEFDALFGEKVFDNPKNWRDIKRVINYVTDEGDWVLDYFAGSGTTAHAAINLAREDKKVRYALIEMGDHFYTVLIPRIKKACYSERWSDGVPIIEEELTNGVSHLFKYCVLESYEDTLGNLSLERSAGQQKLLKESYEIENEARRAYVLNYMLEIETRGSGSLLNTEEFLDPLHYKLKVRSPGGDEARSLNVDLLETFNYLLGLEVEHIAAPIYFDAELNQGEYGRWQAKVKRSETGMWWFRTVYGTNRAGQQVLVVWRNLPSVIDGEADGIQKDNAVLDAVLIEKLSIRLTESQDDEIDVLYVNGDHNISIPRSRKGEPMEQARIQLIEEAFHRLMFADTEAVH